MSPFYQQLYKISEDSGQIFKIPLNYNDGSNCLNSLEKLISKQLCNMSRILTFLTVSAAIMNTSLNLSGALKQLVKELTLGYGESHNHEHAEKVAANAAKIYSAMKTDIIDLHSQGF